MPFVLNEALLLVIRSPPVRNRCFERRFNYFTTWIEAGDPTRHQRTFAPEFPCENIGRP
jgi:hypothetical protein